MSENNNNIATFNSFSIENLFWFEIKPHQINFRFNSLPKDIHFTVAFNENSNDVNLHITRNVSQKEKTHLEEENPQLRIVVIDKKLLENVFPEISLNFINSILEPISIEDLKEKYNNEVGFISFDNLEKFEGYSLSNLFEKFKEIIQIKRKTRLKIRGKIEENILNFVNDEKLQDSIFNQIEDLSIDFSKPVDGGIILTEDKTIHVIRINDNWYNFNLNLKPNDIIKLLIEPKTADYLIEKVKREIEIIKDCNNKIDSEKYNNPMRLEWL